MAVLLSCPQGHRWESLEGKGPDTCPICGAIPLTLDHLTPSAPSLPPPLPSPRVGGGEGWGEGAGGLGGERLTVPPGPATSSFAGLKDAKRSVREQFGRYRIIKSLGKGGMGSVYLAHDTQLDRRVALKVPHFRPEDGSQVLARFYQEARAAATIQHPHICPVYDVGEINGTHYLTMAYIEGKPLTSFIDPAKLPTARQVAALMRKLALALVKAHQAGVIHRDLKPSNIMINKSGEPVIVDFGLARRANQDEQLTQTGMMLGTPCYMPPEQVRGDIDAIGPAADIYSLGVIMYQLLTGLLPFEGKRWAVLGQIMADEAPPPSRHRVDVDPALESVCLKAMAKQIKDRYTSMGALAEVLTDYLKNKSQVPGAKSQPSTAASPSPNTTEERRQPSSGPSEDQRWLFAGNESSIVAESYLQAARRARGKKRLVLGVLFGGLLHMAAIIGLVIYLWPKEKNSANPKTGIRTVRVANKGSDVTRPDETSSDKKPGKLPRAERKQWVHEHGSFTKVKDKQWVEKINENTWYFVEIKQTSEYVELQSKPDQIPVQVRLYDASCDVKFGDDPFRKGVYRGKWDGELKATLPSVSPPDAGGRYRGGPDGFVSLFNGKDLTGWQLPAGTGNWKIQDGAIVSGGPTSHLFSQRGDYQDFHLRAEVQINERGNSGLYFRAPKATGWPKGYEAKINATHQDPQKTGSLYGIKKIFDQLHKPEEWFTLDVKAEGDHIIILVNDQKVVDVRDSKYRKGYIALQQLDEGTVVTFRKIEIKELKLKSPAPEPEVEGLNEKPTGTKPEPVVPPIRPDAEGQAILDKGITAHGGLANLKKFPAEKWKFEGTLNVGGSMVPISGDWAYQPTDKSRVVIRNSDGVVIRIEILNGDTGWIKDWIREKGITRAMNTQELAEAKEQAYANAITWLYPFKEKSFTLSPVGEIEVDGKPAVGLRVSCNGHRDINLFFDKQTNLLVKDERTVEDHLTGQQVKHEFFARKYKQIEGIKYPMKIKTLRDGQPYLDITVSGYKRIEKLNDRLLAKP